ncbi:hypothetical protein V5799_031257 [Amblyomma americanum]|uniref:Uncharacterized protein n=1 Tax=Amblyomma americanum TaxID=6943 RepID=A0AAQ4ELD1_AMBAM
MISLKADVPTRKKKRKDADQVVNESPALYGRPMDSNYVLNMRSLNQHSKNGEVIVYLKWSASDYVALFVPKQCKVA